MKDKEKQILAITQDLSDCLEYDIEDSSVVDTYDTAYNLVNKGWVKQSKDSVVLSADEFANLKKYAYKKGSKEAAKEFYDKFNENICCFKLENKSEDYKNGYTQAIADICGKLDKTAIELGVDLKEYYGK